MHGDLLRPQTLSAAVAGVDTVVLISGADDTMVEAQCNLIDAAKQAGVAHVVKVSGLGPDVNSPFRFGRFHAQIEDYLKGSGVAWTMLRPSQFMQVYFREVPTLLADGIFAQPLGDTRLAPVDVDDIAKVAHAVINSADHYARSYDMTGPEALDMTEICAVLSEVVGKPIRYVDIHPADKRQRLLDAGLPPRFVDDLDDLFALRRAGGPESQVRLDTFETLGIRPTSFAEFAWRSAKVFRGTVTPTQLWASGWQTTP